MKRKKNESELLQLGAAYCANTERCEQEVRRKIASAGGTNAEIDRIIQRLRSEKFIDEARYCRSFVNDHLRFNRWGRIRIGIELRRRGLASGAINEAIEAIDPDLYAQTLTELLTIKRRSLKEPDGRDAWRKLFGFALGRGFEHEAIGNSLQTLFEQQYDEDFTP